MKNRINRSMLRKWLFWFLLVAASIVLYKSFDRLSDVFKGLGSLISLVTPIVAAFAIAYFLNRPMCFFERQFKRLREKNFFRKHSRGFSVAITYVIFIAIIALLCYALIPSLITGIRSIFTDTDVKIAAISAWFNELTTNYTFLAEFDIGDKVIEMLTKFIGSIEVDTLIGYLTSIGDVGSVLANIAVSLFVSIYMLLEKELILAAIGRFAGLFMKESTRASVGNYLTRANTVVYRYFATQFADCVIVSCMATIALLIMGAPSPVLLGFIFGMFNIIPYFGPIIGGVFVVLVILLARGFGFALTATIVLLVLQQIDANIINPKILGASLDLGPFWVIVAITVGGGLFGFTGMLLGVPALVVFRMIYRDVLKYVKHKRARMAAAAAAADTNAAGSPPPVDEPETTVADSAATAYELTVSEPTVELGDDNSAGNGDLPDSLFERLRGKRKKKK